MVTADMRNAASEEADFVPTTTAADNVKKK
jgi:hypothetical protein